MTIAPSHHVRVLLIEQQSHNSLSTAPKLQQALAAAAQSSSLGHVKLVVGSFADAALGSTPRVGAGRRRAPPHVVIVDIDHAGERTNTAWSVTELTRQTPDVAVVVLTEDPDSQRVRQAMREGAQDYLVKDAFDEQLLVRTLDHALIRQRYRTAFRKAA